MLTFLTKRLVAGILTLWLIASLTFALMRIAPGGPFDKEKPLAPAVKANLGRTFGLAAQWLTPIAGKLQAFTVKPGSHVVEGTVLAKLDSGEIHADRDLVVIDTIGSPGRMLAVGDALLARETTLFEQYRASVGSWLRLDFGVTYASEGAETVATTLGRGLPVSAELGLCALLLALLVGVSVGLLAGWKRNTWIDHLAMTGALAAVSASSIVLGPLLVLLFGVHLRWLPWGGWTPLAWDWPHAAVKILPIATLAMVYAAWFARLTRAGMLEVSGQDWIRTARAKGLSDWTIVRRHAFKAAILPAISFLGPAAAGIVTGSVVIERVYSIPGLGEYFVTAAVNRDYPLVIGTAILYSSLLIACNLAVDVVYAWLDPRIRVQS